MVRRREKIYECHSRTNSQTRVPWLQASALPVTTVTRTVQTPQFCKVLRERSKISKDQNSPAEVITEAYL